MSLIDIVIVPRDKDLGGFTVRRILPYAKRRMVGPFIFLDHMGPADFAAGAGIDVRPHPHIGLATVTYLFAGELFHRDTLGSAQSILPGAVNWMTAGRGIAHSEHTGPDERKTPHQAHGLQSWVALPKEYEGTAPEFHHHPASVIPDFSVGHAKLRVVAGRLFGHTAPVKTYSPLFYAEATLPAGSQLVLPKDYQERALYLVTGKLRIGSTTIEPRTMPVFGDDEMITIEALEPSHMMLLGGDPFAEPRFIWWNFVATSEERIAHAKMEWSRGHFGKVPGDEVEFIPLPEV
jgi:hypothetical protein